MTSDVHYEEGARYTLTEDMPRWCGCFIQPSGNQIVKRTGAARPAPLYVGVTETDMAAGDVVTVEAQDMPEAGGLLYRVVLVGNTEATNGAMFG